MPDRGEIPSHVLRRYRDPFQDRYRDQNRNRHDPSDRGPRARPLTFPVAVHDALRGPKHCLPRPLMSQLPLTLTE